MRGPQLERYEILSELGQGGMSVVYRARDRQLSRYVAVKVLHEFLARQTDARKRFHREAVAVAKLHHPGILEIFDYSGPDAKETYIVTELIEGETLRDFIDKRSKPLYPELAVLIVAELIRALKHAHEQSVIHRDLKPENVMITREGVLKLMDFGLAQLMDGGTKLTATGTLLGSPAHMAPEVIDGNLSDARADLFSMGTILYWLAAGKLPFEAANPSALFKRILDGKYEDPQMVEPKIGNGLARIIKRALEPDPAQRYQDVTEILADLNLELESVGLTPPDVQVRRYLCDPERYTTEIGPKLVASLAAAGKQALSEGNLARAMDRFNRVLAIDPDHADVKQEVARLGRKKELARRARQALVMVTAAGLLAGATYGAYRFMPAEAAPTPAENALIAELQPIERAQIEQASRPVELEVERAATATAASIAAVETPAKNRVQDTLSKRPVSAAKKSKEVRVASVGTLPGGDKKDGTVTAEVQPQPVMSEPQPVRTKLKLLIGGAWARFVYLGDEEVGHDTFMTTLDLVFGEHEITIEGFNGVKERRKIRVDERGQVEVYDATNGYAELKGDVLRVHLPGSR